MATKIQKITPNLWFNREAEEAARFYVSVFSGWKETSANSKVGKISCFGKEGYEIHGMPEGTAMTVEFELDGQKFVALNGGPLFKFSEAVSFIINCQTQEEVDYFWEKLGEGGDPQAQQCGWLKDKYGLSWQVIPDALYKLMDHPDRKKAGRAMNAMLQMKKIDIQQMEEA